MMVMLQYSQSHMPFILSQRKPLGPGRPATGLRHAVLSYLIERLVCSGTVKMLHLLLVSAQIYSGTDSESQRKAMWHHWWQLLLMAMVAGDNCCWGQPALTVGLALLFQRLEQQQQLLPQQNQRHQHQHAAATGANNDKQTDSPASCTQQKTNNTNTATLRHPRSHDAARQSTCSCSISPAGAPIHWRGQ